MILLSAWLENVYKFLLYKYQFVNIITLVKITFITLWTFFRMSVSNQRNSVISSFSEFTTIQRRFIIFDDDKIKINKSDIYHENRNELNNWFTQIDVYFAFNQIINNKQILFVFIFFKKKRNADSNQTCESISTTKKMKTTYSRISTTSKKKFDEFSTSSMKNKQSKKTFNI